jgi:hypothetical protein
VGTLVLSDQSGEHADRPATKHRYCVGWIQPGIGDSMHSDSQWLDKGSQFRTDPGWHSV